MTPPNPQSPTPEETSGGPLRPLPGCTFAAPTPSPTLQSAAEGAAREIQTGIVGVAVDSESDISAIILRHFSFVEALVRENERLNALLNAEAKEVANRGCRIMVLESALSAARADLESSRSQWRMSSVCRELNAELEKVRAERDAAVKEAENADGAREAIAIRVNALAKEHGTKAAPDHCPACVGQAIDDLIFSLHEKTLLARQEASELLARAQKAEGELSMCDFVLSETCELVGAKNSAEAKENVRVMKAQLAAADEMAEALESLRDDAETRDEQMLPHSLPRASTALSAYQAARTQGGAGV